MKKLVLFSTTVFSLSLMAQEMSSSDNQCRIQAKEIALKTYQSCVTDAKTARIEELKKEYQEKLSELKKQYEAQIKELKTAKAAQPVSASPKVETTQAADAQAEAVEKTQSPAPAEKPATENVVPTTIEEDVAPAQKADAVQSQDLTLDQPTIVLKPANAKQASSSKNKKSGSTDVAAVKATTPIKTTAGHSTVTKTTKAKPVVAQKRATGEKPVKGIAKTLPAKQKAVETKLVTTGSPIEKEVAKSAPISPKEIEKNQVAQEKNETTGQTETLTEPALQDAQASENQETTQQ